MKPSTERATAGGRGVGFDAMPSPTAAKTMAIVDVLARHPQGVSSAQAARAAGVTGNLAFRILKTLVAQGYCLQQQDTKEYTLSRQVLDLAGPKAGERSLAVAAYDPMRSLRDLTGETVQLVIEAAGKAVVLEQVRGTHALQVCGQVGMRIPLYSCAPGKAILASWPEERRRAWLRSHDLKRFTAATLVTQRALLTDLEDTRGRGFAVDHGEGIEGIHCVAAAVLDTRGEPVAALTVMAPAARLPEGRFADVAARCIRAARTIASHVRE
jgi:DNA-binding IclR family transcriptional regulator